VGASGGINSHSNNGAVPDALQIEVETGVVNGKAVQYKTVPYTKANVITIQFSEPVKYCAPSGQSKLQVTGTAGISYPVRQPTICNTNPNATSTVPSWTI
jgi:hypothetical protein